MTKKDYETIANTIKDYIAFERKMGDDPNARIIESFVTSADGLAFRLGQENPRFDRNKFLQACGFGVLDCTHTGKLNRYNSFWSECENCGMQINNDGQVINDFEQPMFKHILKD